MMHALPLVDPGRMAEMEAEFGREVLPDLLALFIEEGGQIASSLGGLHGLAAIHAMHTLKGSAETMGMSALARTCRVAERSLRDGGDFHPGEIAALTRASCRAFQRAVDQMRNSDRIGSAVMSR